MRTDHSRCTKVCFVIYIRSLDVNKWFPSRVKLFKTLKIPCLLCISCVQIWDVSKKNKAMKLLEMVGYVFALHHNSSLQAGACCRVWTWPLKGLQCRNCWQSSHPAIVTSVTIMGTVVEQEWKHDRVWGKYWQNSSGLEKLHEHL